MKKIVIKIPEEIYNSACATNNTWSMRMAGFVCSAIANGKVLPSGHGRLIDADAVLEEPIGNTYKDIDIAETIIEADKEG